MDILASVLLSLSTNMDNFAVGAACGVKKLTIRFPANLLIACLSGASTFISMLLGEQLILTANLARPLGSAILVFVGFLSIKTSQETALIEGDNKNLVAHRLERVSPVEDAISLKTAFIVGTVLTITNFGTGIGAGIAQIDIVLTSCLSFLSSLFLVESGSMFGSLASRWLPRRLDMLAGILLIFLGLYECFF